MAGSIGGGGGILDQIYGGHLELLIIEWNSIRLGGPANGIVVDNMLKLKIDPHLVVFGVVFVASLYIESVGHSCDFW